MKENEYTQEERNAFKEEIERTAILEQSITNVLSQHHEVYLADDKFVLNFTDFQGEKTGAIEFRHNASPFTTYITLKHYSKDLSHLEISIPDNDALFIRIPTKLHSASLQRFKALPEGRSKVMVELRFLDQEVIQIIGELYFSFEEHTND